MDGKDLSEIVESASQPGSVGHCSRRRVRKRSGHWPLRLRSGRIAEALDLALAYLGSKLYGAVQFIMRTLPEGYASLLPRSQLSRY
jgi:hypothetical protein